MKKKIFLLEGGFKRAGFLFYHFFVEINTISSSDIRAGKVWFTTLDVKVCIQKKISDEIDLNVFRFADQYGGDYRTTDSSCPGTERKANLWHQQVHVGWTLVQFTSLMLIGKL